MKYFYITGRGHSGSTVIDAMLGNSKSIESVGELVSGIGREDEICSCGTGMQECEYWVKVRRDFETKSGQSWEQFAKETVKSGHVKRFLGTLAGNSKSDKQLVKQTEYFVQSLLNVAGKNAILDSSKNPNRALFLARYYRESKIIHLVKHPEGVAASRYQRIIKGDGYKFLRRKYSNPKLAPILVSVEALSWFIGNSLIEIIRLVKPGKVLLLKYEDLGTKPEIIINKLSEFLEVDLKDVLDAILEGRPFTFGHNIGGNGIRYKESFVFNTQQGKRRSLPTIYKVLISTICWPLMWRYNYKIFGY